MIGPIQCIGMLGILLIVSLLGSLFFGIIIHDADDRYDHLHKD